MWDPDELAEYWDGGVQPEWAVHHSGVFIRQVMEGRLDPVENLGYLERAVEVMADGPGGDPVQAMICAREVQRSFRRAERGGDAVEELRRYYRARPWIMLAAAQHRAPGHGREAFGTALAALTWIEDVAGGREALREVLGRRSPNVVAEIAVAALGIYPATVRRGIASPTVREQYLLHGRYLLEAYLRLDRDPAEDPGPTVYPRTAAVAVQWFFALVERGNPGDVDLVHALFALDVKTRPDTVRSRATAALRDLEYARFCGDAAGVKRHLRIARASIVEFPLERHQEVIARQGYLAA